MESSLPSRAISVAVRCCFLAINVTVAPTELIGHYRSLLEPLGVQTDLYKYLWKAGVEVGLDALFG
ncbi:hypothetical protein [Mesorhizobium sp. 128a]